MGYGCLITACSGGCNRTHHQRTSVGERDTTAISWVGLVTSAFPAFHLRICHRRYSVLSYNRFQRWPSNVMRQATEIYRYRKNSLLASPLFLFVHTMTKTETETETASTRTKTTQSHCLRETNACRSRGALQSFREISALLRHCIHIEIMHTRRTQEW